MPARGVSGIGYTRDRADAMVRILSNKPTHTPTPRRSRVCASMFLLGVLVAGCSSTSSTRVAWLFAEDVRPLLGSGAIKLGMDREALFHLAGEPHEVAWKVWAHYAPREIWVWFGRPPVEAVFVAQFGYDNRVSDLFDLDKSRRDDYQNFGDWLGHVLLTIRTITVDPILVGSLRTQDATSWHDPSMDRPPVPPDRAPRSFREFVDAMK
jgi:hypothetical protein